MSRRIKIDAILAPNGIYQRCALPASGYRPSETSRFAVVRTGPEAPWRLIHVTSGGALDTIFPALPRKLTLADKMATAAAWEAATHIDWSAFDALPAVSLATTQPPALGAGSASTIAEMKALAETAIS